MDDRKGSRTIIFGATVVTMSPQKQLLNNGFLIIEGGMFSSIGEGSAYKDLVTENSAVIDAEGKFIYPGLINTHTHIFQTLLRGVGQDLPVWQWFEQVLDPTVVALTPEDAYLSAKLGAVEAIKSGTTTILDYNYPHPFPGMAEETIRAFQEVGIRSILARGIIDTGHVHKKIIHSTRDELEACEQLLIQYHHKDNDMVRIWLAPYAVFSTSKEAFIQSKEMAANYDTWLTVHAATPSSIESSIRLYGVEDAVFENDIGFLGPNVLAVHCCGPLSDQVMNILRDRDVKISHNPVSNAYLGEGIAPISAMLKKGIHVSIATDGPASNNNQDMVSALKYTALLQKVSHLDPSVISAEKVLEMATIEGAKCIGMEGLIGSIEVGKRADLFILNPWMSNTVVFHDPIGCLVYSATPENIETVIVNGEIIMDKREVCTVDEKETMVKADFAAKKLLKRAKIA